MFILNSQFQNQKQKTYRFLRKTSSNLIFEQISEIDSLKNLVYHN